MHFPLCVVFLAVCIVAWECTASDVVSDKIVKVPEDVSEIAVTATTTTAAATPPIQVQQPINAPEHSNGEEEHTQSKPAEEDGQPPEKMPAKGQVKGDTHQPGTEDKPPIKGGDQSERQDTHVNVVGLPAATKTTTTAENINSDQNPKGSLEQANDDQEPDLTSGQEVHAKTPGEQLHQDVVGADVSHGDAAQNQAGQKRPQVRDISADLTDVKGPSIPEEKTTTTTAAIHKPSDPKGDNRKKQSNGPQNKESPDLEVKDAIPAGQSTNPSATKTGREGAQSSTTSGGATGGKKEQKASSASSPTTATTAKKDNHGAIKPGANSGEKTTIQKQKETSTTTTTDEPTISTVASTTSLPNGFKIPQSLDKTDGSSSSSLLFAFSIVVTFTVLSVTPVY